MKLPNRERAVIAPDKLTAYLLNIDHERGGTKARLFAEFGYNQGNWRQLEAHIRRYHLDACISIVWQILRRLEVAATSTKPAYAGWTPVAAGRLRQRRRDFNRQPQVATFLKCTDLDAEVDTAKRTMYGIRYEIRAPVETPSGRTLILRTIWQIDEGTDVPRLITLFLD